MKRLLPARLLAALRREVAEPRDLPDDLVRAARGRVRVAVVLGATAYAALFVLELSGAISASALEHRINLAHDLAGVALCSSLALASGVRRIGDRALLAAALGVEVVLCAVISVAAQWASFLHSAHLQGHTWVVSVIIVFALLVPVRPATSFVVSSLCALTMPLGILALDLAGRIDANAGDYWRASVAGLIALAIATAGARAIYDAGRQVAAARELGGYELTEEIGRGGGGEVWKGKHLLLARAAAVKLILPEALVGSSERLDTALARFTQEAQIVSDLRSPHTVQLYDFGSTSAGSLYIVMELLEGMNLQHFVYRYGAIEPRRAVHWLRQTCDSLGEAHARGLVHRDIKPSNLFVCRYGREVDYIKVLDFGLARAAVLGDQTTLTAPGMHPGTPGYMAPEQIYGLPITAATDLYALGCVAYWLLTGVMPFDGSAGEVMRMHAQSPPASLSVRARQPIPARLEQLVMRCLAKDPADRPQDADCFLAELGESIDGDAWTPADAHAWWAGHFQ